ncbi:ABC transporter ATP-binding protein [Pseudonocardia kongjuensis]|uniref:ABC transporter ATP-binding protein n=1 Tax=Pseudonocardia kongjuensis TaxID=102227 RepID=A0ABN1Y1U8_9PSEU
MTLSRPLPAGPGTAPGHGPDPDAGPPLVSVRGLRIATTGGTPLVHGVDLDLVAGATVGIVGESGSGKTLTAMAVAGLLPRGVTVTGGRIAVDGRDVTVRSPAERRALLRDTFGVVFQNPAVSLNPRLTIGRQLREALPDADRRSRARAWRRSLELLEHVGVPRAAQRLRAYPHELSGGLNQRVVIATAIARDPRVLVADEATTALDVSVQQQVLDLLDRLRDELRLGVLLVSHDIGVIADRAGQVVVMQDGAVVERGGTGDVLDRPQDGYTRRLLAAVPRLDVPSPAGPPADAPVLLAGRGLVRDFPVAGRRGTRLRAVDHVDITLRAGQALGVVGESGSGKTTLARILVGIDPGHGGTLTAFGGPVTGRVPARRRQLRRVQYVFQDPYAALDPRQTVAESIAEPIELAGTRDQRDRVPGRVAELLDDVQLARDLGGRRPHELSGGQRQRVVIARALALEPDVLIADEPVSALDLSVQAGILDLLARLRAERDLTYLVISHDLAVVRGLCTDVLVLHDGVEIEQGPTDDVFTAPAAGYTRRLLDAVPGRSRQGSPPELHPAIPRKDNP